MIKLLMRDLNDATKLKIEWRTDMPAGAVALPALFDNEEAEWLEIVKIPDPNDPAQLIDAPQINQTKKQAVLAQRNQAQLDEQARIQALRTLRQNLRDIRDTDATNIAQCNTRLKQLARACLETIRILIADNQ